MGIKVRPAYLASRSARKTALLSPEAPELVASAASTNANVPVPKVFWDALIMLGNSERVTNGTCIFS
jgi:hypothetical protein